MKKSKKQSLSDFESLVRENVRRIYEAAYAVKGERTAAEQLAEDAIFYGAKCYGDLMNKDRVLDIILARIGHGNANGFEMTDSGVLCDRALTRAYTWQARKRVFISILSGALILALCICVMLPFLPREIVSQSNNVILMEEASVIMGEQENIEFVNYQQITKMCAFNQESFDQIVALAGKERVLAAVTAPDGTPYVAFNNLETLDGSDTTVTLYRGYKKGWDPVATAEIGAVQEMIYGTIHTLFKCSELYLYADKDSDIYMFFRIDTDVLIYKYDSKMETFEEKQVIPFAKIDTFRTLSVEFDLDAGEKGAAYFSCNEAGSVKIYRYDAATDTLSVMVENLEMPMATVDFIFCAKNDTVYGVTKAHSTVVLYRILSDGTVESKKLSGVREKFYSIEIDYGGNVHLLGIRDGLKHYIVKPDMSVSFSDLEVLYYQDTDYIRELLGVYIGDDGNLYYLECYYNTDMNEACFVAIGELDRDDPAKTEMIDGLDTLDNIENPFFINGKDIVFLSSPFYSYEETYLVYFHICEIEEEG